MTLLEIERLDAFHGVSQALFGVSLAVGEGEVVALMGRNGMGKTTTIRAILGLVRTAGSVRFEGHELSGWPSHRIARLGIGLVPEGRRCFPNLTVAENLVASARPGPWVLKAVTGLFPPLGDRLAQRASTLSGGEQQMLAIGRALMTNPRLLVLDEATEGLAPVIRQAIWAAIGRLKREGQAILVVDKVLSELLAAADRAFVLEKGATVWAGRPAALTPDLQDRYLGV